MTTMERRPDSRGKVRDIYDAGDNLLMVASDRISAFDYILPDEIPYKGEVLNRISAFWFDTVSYTHLQVLRHVRKSDRFFGVCPQGRCEWKVP